MAISSNNKKVENLLNILRRLEKRQELSTNSLVRVEEWQKTQGVQRAYVTSAVKLTQEEEKELTVNLGFIYGKNFIIEQRTQPDLLGGLKIKIGSQIIDATLEGQLEKIKSSLKKLTR